MNPGWDWLRNLLVYLGNVACGGIVGNMSYASLLLLFPALRKTFRIAERNGIDQSKSSGIPSPAQVAEFETKYTLAPKISRVRWSIFAVIALVLDVGALWTAPRSSLHIGVFIGFLTAELIIVTAASATTIEGLQEQYRKDPTIRKRLNWIVTIAFWGFLWCLISLVNPIERDGPTLLKQLLVFLLLAIGSYGGFIWFPKWGFKFFGTVAASLTASALLASAFYPPSLPSITYLLERRLVSVRWIASLFPPPNRVSVDDLNSVDELKFVDPGTGIPTLFYAYDPSSKTYELADGPGFDHFGTKLEPAIDQRYPIINWVKAQIAQRNEQVAKAQAKQQKELADGKTAFYAAVTRRDYDAAANDLENFAFSKTDRADMGRDLCNAEIRDLPDPGQLIEPAASEWASNFKRSTQFDPDQVTLAQTLEQRLRRSCSDSPASLQAEIRFDLDTGQLSNSKIGEIVFPEADPAATVADLHAADDRLFAVHTALQSWTGLETPASAVMQQSIDLEDTDTLIRLLSEGELRAALQEPFAKALEVALGQPSREGYAIKLVARLKQDFKDSLGNLLSPSILANAITSQADQLTDAAALEWLLGLSVDWNLDTDTQGSIASKLLNLTNDDDPQLAARAERVLKLADYQPSPPSFRKLFIGEFVSGNWAQAERWLKAAQDQGLLISADEARIAGMRCWGALHRSLQSLLQSHTEIVMRQRGADSSGRSIVSCRFIELQNVDDGSFAGAVMLGTQQEQEVRGKYTPNEIALTFGDDQEQSAIKVEPVDLNSLAGDGKTAWGPVTTDDLVLRGTDASGQTNELLLPSPESHSLTAALGRRAEKNVDPPTVAGNRIAWDSVEFSGLHLFPVQNLQINRPMMLRGEIAACQKTTEEWADHGQFQSITVTLTVTRADNNERQYTVARLKPQKLSVLSAIAIPADATLLTFNSSGEGSVVLINFRMYPLQNNGVVPPLVSEGQ
jgi:hypothetical protein